MMGVWLFVWFVYDEIGVGEWVDVIVYELIVVDVVVCCVYGDLFEYDVWWIE